MLFQQSHRSFRLLLEYPVMVPGNQNFVLMRMRCKPDQKFCQLVGVPNVRAVSGVNQNITDRHVDLLVKSVSIRKANDLGHGNYWVLGFWVQHRSHDTAGVVAVKKSWALHRGRQLAEIVLACGPLASNHRGLRLPLVGWVVGLAQPGVAPVAALGLVDDLWSGPERGFRAHLQAGGTTGVLKLVGIPAYALLRTRSLSGAVLVGLAANVLNQLDTKPGRALKAFLIGSALLGGRPRRTVAVAVLLAPYDLGEMAMLGDSGSNALGAVLGFSSVERFSRRQRWSAIAALAGLTLLGERRSLGALIERTPVFRELDALGRQS